MTTWFVSDFIWKQISSCFFKTDKLKTVLKRWAWHWLSLWLFVSHKARTVVCVFACFHGKSHPSSGIRMNCNFFLYFVSCWIKDPTVVLQAQDKATEFLFSWSLAALVVPGAPANPEGKAQPVRNWLDWGFSGFTQKRVIAGSQQKSCSFWE